MMKITIDLTPEQESGLAVVVAAFNARQGDTDNLTAEEYAANEFAHVARQWEGAAKEALVAKVAALPYADLAELEPAIEAKRAAKEVDVIAVGVKR